MTADRPSATALLIARSLVFLSRDPAIGSLIPPETVELSRLLVRGSSAGGPLLRLVEWGWFRRLVWGLERASIPGMMLHYVLRKRALEDTARHALSEGCRQVMVLGGGFDTLALRLAREHPDRRFIELDHPATQAAKLKILAEAGHMPTNLRFLPVDLTQDRLGDAVGPELEPGAGTLCVAEGVLMYLSERDVDGLFRFCRERNARFAFTFMERLPGGRIAFRGQNPIVDLWLRRRGEPFRWGVPLGELEGFLAERGFRCRSLATPDVLRQRCLPAELRGQPLADGDHVCVADPEALTPDSEYTVRKAC
jgi:methyltransferase (TIGR00027 family)